MASPAFDPDIVLDRAGADDVDEVMVVMEAAFGSAFGEAWTRSQLTGILPMAGVELVVARCASGSVLAGFSLARTVADEAELLLIAVDPDYQGRGVGGLLVDHFIHRSGTDGLRRIHLEVRDGNRAERMYRDRGFETVGRRRDYYQGKDRQRYDAITLAREFE